MILWWSKLDTGLMSASSNGIYLFFRPLALFLIESERSKMGKGWDRGEICDVSSLRENRGERRKIGVLHLLIAQGWAIICSDLCGGISYANLLTIVVRWVILFGKTIGIVPLVLHSS